MGIFDDILANVGEPYKGGKGFEYGAHEVIIGTAEAKQKDTQKAKDCAIIEIEVFDETDNDKKGKCTLWFHTTGGAQTSVAKILGIMVHNVGEDKKDKVRELGKQLFGNISDTTKSRDIAIKLINDKLLTKKAYFVANPQNGYTTTSYGDISPYPAEPQSKQQENVLGGEDVTEEVAGDLPDFGDL